MNHQRAVRAEMQWMAGWSNCVVRTVHLKIRSRTSSRLYTEFQSRQFVSFSELVKAAFDMPSPISSRTETCS